MNSLADGKNKEIKIYVNQIPAQGLSLEGVLGAKDLSLNYSDINFLQPLRIKVQAHKITNAVAVKVQIKTEMRAACSRCLAQISQDLERSLDFNYQAKNMQDCIDIGEDLRQEIILDNPVKILCRSDCKGLCPQCGKNLNEGDCECIKKR